MYSNRSNNVIWNWYIFPLPPSASTVVFPVIAVLHHAPPIARVINHHHSPVSNHPIRRHIPHRIPHRIPPRRSPRLFRQLFRQLSPRLFPRRCFYWYFQLLLRLFFILYHFLFCLFLCFFLCSSSLTFSVLHLYVCISPLYCTESHLPSNRNSFEGEFIAYFVICHNNLSYSFKLFLQRLFLVSSSFSHPLLPMSLSLIIQNPTFSPSTAPSTKLPTINPTAIPSALPSYVPTTPPTTHNPSYSPSTSRPSTKSPVTRRPD